MVPPDIMWLFFNSCYPQSKQTDFCRWTDFFRNRIVSTFFLPSTWGKIILPKILIFRINFQNFFTKISCLNAKSTNVQSYPLHNCETKHYNFFIHSMYQNFFTSDKSLLLIQVCVCQLLKQIIFNIHCCKVRSLLATHRHIKRSVYTRVKSRFFMPGG